MWIFNKPKDFDCRNCMFNNPHEILNKTKKHDECTHPRQRYQFSWIERDNNWFFTLALGICGSKARRFKEKQC